MDKSKNILPSPKDLLNTLSTAKKEGMNFDDFISAIKENSNSDIKDKILQDVINKLFNKNELLMIARLDNNLAFYVVKHLIINNFYATYYYSIKYRITIVKSSIPPFYDRKIYYERPNEKTIIRIAYDRFLSELLQVTISFQGKGRQELISIYDSINERIRREETQNPLLRGFGLVK